MIPSPVKRYNDQEIEIMHEKGRDAKITSSVQFYHAYIQTELLQRIIENQEKIITLLNKQLPQTTTNDDSDRFATLDHEG